MSLGAINSHCTRCRAVTGAGLFVIVAVLCYNFVGDGVRDADDRFSHR